MMKVVRQSILAPSRIVDALQKFAVDLSETSNASTLLERETWRPLSVPLWEQVVSVLYTTIQHDFGDDTIACVRSSFKVSRDSSNRVFQFRTKNISGNDGESAIVQARESGYIHTIAMLVSLRIRKDTLRIGNAQCAPKVLALIYKFCSGFFNYRFEVRRNSVRIADVLTRYKIDMVSYVVWTKETRVGWRDSRYVIQLLLRWSRKRVKSLSALQKVIRTWVKTCTKWTMHVSREERRVSTIRYTRKRKSIALKDRSTTYLISHCDAKKLFENVIQKCINMKHMKEWFVAGDFLSYLKQEVLHSVANGMNTDKVEIKLEQIKDNMDSYVLQCSARHHVSLLFRDGKRVGNSRVIHILGLAVEFRSILWNSRVQKSAVPSGTYVKFLFQSQRKMIIPPSTSMSVKNFRIFVSRKSVRHRVETWNTSIGMSLEFLRTKERKKKESDKMSISDALKGVHRHQTRSWNDEIANLPDEISSLSNDKITEKYLIYIRSQLLSLKRTKLSKILHGRVGIRRHLSEREMCGNERHKIEDRSGRCLREVFGSKTCPRDVQVMLLVAPSQRGEYRKMLLGTSTHFHRIASDDTGERTCWSIFDVWNGLVFFIGDRFSREYLRKTHIPRARIVSRLSDRTIKADTKRRLEHQLSILRSNFARRQRALHKTMVNFMTNMYDVIIKPKFGIKSMTRRSRRLSAEISARMLCIGHGKFVVELRRVCEERNVILDESTDERHSSKCCGRCGRINKSLGGSKTFVCSYCGNVEERGVYLFVSLSYHSKLIILLHTDGGAARKILVRWVYATLVEHFDASNVQ